MLESRRRLCRMRLKFKSTYELMDYTAQLFDFSPEQRKEFYKTLEEENVLKTSQDPVKDATRLAKKIAAKSAGKAGRDKAAQAGATGVPRTTPRRPPLDEDEEDEIEDYGGYPYNVDSDTPEEES